MLSISISKIVGAASNKHWSQVHSFEPSGGKLGEYGVLLLAVKVSVLIDKSEEIKELATVGKEFIQRFHEQYYGSEGTTDQLMSHLNSSVESVVSEFGEESKLAVEVVVGVILAKESQDKSGVLYIAANKPSSSAFLVRDQKIYRLLGEKKRAEATSEKITASGYLAEGDKLILGTEDFFKLISMDVLKSALVSDDPSEISSVLAPHVHEEEESSGVAAVIGLIREGSGDVSQRRSDDETFVKGEVVKDLRERMGRWKKFGLKSIQDKILNKFPGFPRLRSAFSEEEIVVKEGRDRQRRVLFSVAFVLLILLGVSIFFGWKRRIAKEEEERFTAVWEVSDHQYKEAGDLVELNPLRARSLLIDAKSIVEETLADESIKLSRVHVEQLSGRMEEIAGMLERVSGEHKVEEAQIFLDLNLVRPDTFGEIIALHEDKLVVLDPSSKVLLRVDLTKKESETVGGGTFMKGAELATVYVDRGFVFSNSGVVEVSLLNKTSSIVIEPDSEWGEIVNMKAYAGNLYLLSRSQGEIFRYQGVEGGFGQRRRWLGEGVFPDFSKTVSMAIDGDIWVLTGNEVMKFRRGSQEVFTLSGLEKSLQDPVAIYTDADSDYFYILDQGNKRVVAFDKNGEYKAQYIWEGIEAVSDMVVSENEGKILLLSGSTIYEIELQN